MAGLGDHDSAVLVTKNISFKKCKTIKRTLHLWKKANIEQMKEDCKNFKNHFKHTSSVSDSIEDLWKQIKVNLLTIIKNNVPTKSTSPHWPKPWINSKLKRIIRLKQKYYRKMKETNSEHDHIRFNELKKKSQKECRIAHGNHVQNLLDGDKNKKKFYNYIKTKSNGRNTQIVELKDTNGTYHQEPNSKANILNEQFSSIFSNPDISNDINFAGDKYETHHEMKDIVVDEAGVRKLLLALDENKATGPDLIPSRLLKILANEIAPVLTILFQASIDQGKIPSDWKEANIMPIYKKGNKSTPENYRPISLTSICCKVLEHIIYSTVINHLERNDLLSDIQHGFRTKRSCESQLITTCHDFISCLNCKEQTDAILLDFSKAFDKVDHHSLLAKIERCGISETICKWIESFLTNRTQKVLLEGKESKPSIVKSGVPQGTVLGPLLFLIYINDIAEGLNDGTQLRLFADDSLLYRTIKTPKDADLLQNDLNKLQIWEKRWKMEFHPQKCQVLRITNKVKPIVTNYTIHNETLQCTMDAKYLGVTLDSKMKWKKHVGNIANKANKTLGFLNRQINQGSKAIKKQCYETYVRPILEYASSVWDPFYNTEINELEKVQRRAARFVHKNYDPAADSHELVKELGWQSLTQRRKNNKLVAFHKALIGEIHIPTHHLQNNHNRTRNSNLTFRLPDSKINSHLYSFFPSTIRLWNKLPTTTKQQPSTSDFKRSLLLHNT